MPAKLPALARPASTWLVAVSGWIVGHAASAGMDPRQATAAALALGGSILVAVLVHAGPQRTPRRAG